MELNDLVANALRAVRERGAEAGVVLLHPASRYRSMVVAQLMNLAGETVFYYAMGPDDIDVRSFLSGITHDRPSQHPTFGRHVNLARCDQPAAGRSLDAFVADIMDPPFTLILDEYDRTDGADDIQWFVEQTILRAPARCRIVINSRRVC